MKKYFYIDDSPFYPEKYMIRINPEGFPMPHGLTGSYGVIEARLMNMDYVTYQRYLRDVLGADLKGKNARYTTAYFDLTPELKAFVKLLNARMEYVMNEQKFPYEYVKKEDGDIERIPFSSNESNG